MDHDNIPICLPLVIRMYRPNRLSAATMLLSAGGGPSVRASSELLSPEPRAVPPR